MEQIVIEGRVMKKKKKFLYSTKSCKHINMWTHLRSLMVHRCCEIAYGEHRAKGKFNSINIIFIVKRSKYYDNIILI